MIIVGTRQCIMALFWLGGRYGDKTVHESCCPYKDRFYKRIIDWGIDMVVDNVWFFGVIMRLLFSHGQVCMKEWDSCDDEAVALLRTSFYRDRWMWLCSCCPYRDRFYKLGNTCEGETMGRCGDETVHEGCCPHKDRFYRDRCDYRNRFYRTIN